MSKGRWRIVFFGIPAALILFRKLNDSRPLESQRTALFSYEQAFLLVYLIYAAWAYSAYKAFLT